MLKKWLNFIIHLTNKVYHAKKKLQYSNIVFSVFWGIYIILLEVFIALISLPLYIFIKPGRTGQMIRDQECPGNNFVFLGYCLRRKLTILSIVAFFIILILKIAAVYVIGSTSITELSEAFFDSF